jgi:hypothetical protein
MLGYYLKGFPFKFITRIIYGPENCSLHTARSKRWYDHLSFILSNKHFWGQNELGPKDYPSVSQCPLSLDDFSSPRCRLLVRDQTHPSEMKLLRSRGTGLISYFTKWQVQWVLCSRYTSKMYDAARTAEEPFFWRALGSLFPVTETRHTFIQTAPLYCASKWISCHVFRRSASFWYEQWVCIRNHSESLSS